MESKKSHIQKKVELKCDNYSSLMSCINTELNEEVLTENNIGCISNKTMPKMENKDKILVCAAHFYPHVGGYEKYILELYSRIIEQFEVYILVSDFEKNSIFEEYYGLNIIRLDSWCFLGNTYPIPKLSIKNYKTLKKILNNDYLFINTHTRFFFMSLLGYMISKIKKTELIHTEHGIGTAVYKNKTIETSSYIYDKTLGPLIVRGSKFTIGISKASEDFLKKLGSKKSFIIPNCVDTTNFCEKQSHLKNSLNINKNSTIITFVGRLTYPKGVQDLIQAFYILKQKKLDLKLLIVGDGTYLSKLQKLADNNPNIIFLGKRNDIPEILNITDIFVNPSHYEGLPTSVLEAASVGVPIVATNVGGTKEMFIKEMGYLVDEKDPNGLASSIKKIIENKSKVNSQMSREHILKNYCWQKKSEEFIQIIKDNF
ncbi:MAG: glycosyltransferase family 4 protein [Methanobacteriaceae archaeon]|nr:glycosyltransferase family 4 protein [Methanobacteriaceae archaeon]